MTDQTIGAFEAYGIEIEYMIVDRETLSVLPIADRVLVDEEGQPTSDVSDGAIEWSNELVLHVIELKVAEPARSLADLPSAFQKSAAKIIAALEPHGATLLPTGMHPWMNPDNEMKRWPHDQSEIYAAFDRIFDCRGHGWSNLQSTHLNLPFADDFELGPLHAAIRAILPLLPALCASSPIYEGRKQAWRDSRLAVYSTNARRIKEVTGLVIPEPVYSKAEYDAVILEPLYRAIAPLDPEGILQHEWLNARGAITRFDRNTIEIRVMDTQEYPAADIAIVDLVTETLKGWTRGELGDLDQIRRLSTESLRKIFDDTMTHAEDALIEDGAFLRAIGLSGSAVRAREAWGLLAEARGEIAAPIDVISRDGTLASRIANALPAEPSREDLTRVYRQLQECLKNGVPFRP